MSEGLTLDGSTIKGLLEEVAAELNDDVQRRVVIVGGSLLAWHELRDATRDVDSIERLDGRLLAAVEVVAARHGLAKDWLNDHAAAFTPFGFDTAGCSVLVDHPQLQVLGAPFRDVFLMKLRRGHPQDLVDMRSVWPHVVEQFSSAAEVVEQFYVSFPDELADPHLAEFVVAELAKGGVELPIR